MRAASFKERGRDGEEGKKPAAFQIWVSAVASCFRHTRRGRGSNSWAARVYKHGQAKSSPQINVMHEGRVEHSSPFDDQNVSVIVANPLNVSS